MYTYNPLEKSKIIFDDDGSGAANATIAAHLAEADPHPQYPLETDIPNLVQQNETITSFTKSGNDLIFVDEAGASTTIDLSIYLDDTNLSRIVNGTLGAGGIATFTRDDASTFTLDLSSLLDDQNASQVPFTPVGSLVAVTVQDALAEVDSNITAETAQRIAGDTALQGQITTNASDISTLQTSKRDNTAQKNSIEDDAGDLQLVGDQATPGNLKVYSTNAIGVKGWNDLPASGPASVVNQAKLYKGLSIGQNNINNLTEYDLLYNVAATFDNAVFQPISAGTAVQLLVDLENVTIIGSCYVTATNSARYSMAPRVNINNIDSEIEGGGYIRRTGGHDEEYFSITETFSSLPAGTVIKIRSVRTAASVTTAQTITNKGMFSIQGFIPTGATTLVNFPAPLVTSIELI